MEITVLGPVRVLVGGSPVAVGGPKQRLLLAVLACRAGRAVGTNQLIEALWGRHAPASAADNLRLYVHRLRRALGRDRIAGSASSGYVLEVSPEHVDSHRFASLVATGRETLSAGDPALALRLLGDALALWQGEPFADLANEPALHDQAARLRELRLAALESRIEADLRVGNHAAVTGELIGLVAEYPFRERLHAQLMLAYYRSGRQADALAVYYRVRTVLIDELGVEPGNELRDLHQAVLRRDPSLDDYRPHPPPWVNAVATQIPAQLPAGVADFVGRKAQLAHLDGLAATDDAAASVVIIAISGSAGVGKTALAVKWAHRVAGRFPDGQLYVDLRGHDSTRSSLPAAALAAFLQALGVPAGQIPAGEQAMAAMYRSLLAGRRVLVVLDNAAGAEQIRPLLPGDPGCLVLVTSRDALTGLTARDGARRLLLESLTAGEAATLLDRMIGSERVEAEPVAANTLARTCGHLPLALRIAAAQLQDEPGRSLADYVAAIRRVGPLVALRISGEDELAVRPAFDESYRNLAPPVAEVFRRLGLVPGPDFTVAAAAALTDRSTARVARLLDRLVAVHLVDRRGAGRYVLHDLLREYAQAQLESAESAQTQSCAKGRLFRWYLRRSDAAGRLLFPDTLRLPGSDLGGNGFADRAEALAWLDDERPNLIAAATAAGRDPEHREVAWLLADALRRYSWIRSDAVGWLALAETGLAAATAAGNLHGRASAELGLGLADIQAGQFQNGVTHLRRAISLSRRASWDDCQAVSYGNLGIAYSELGQLRPAIDHFGKALAINERLDRRGGLATNLGNLGLLQLRMGRFGSARDHLARALALRSDGAGRGNRGVFLTGLGTASAHLGDTREALDDLIESVTICAELGDVNDQVEAECSLARLHAHLGRHDDATHWADAAVEHSQPSSAPIKAVALAARAATRLAAGQDEPALADSRAALQLADSVGQYVELVVLAGLAAAEQRNGKLVDARTRATQVALKAKATGYRHLHGQALATIAATYLGNVSDGMAARYARQALAIQRRSGDRLSEASTLTLLASALPEAYRKIPQLPAGGLRSG